MASIKGKVLHNWYSELIIRPQIESGLKLIWKFEVVSFKNRTKWTKTNREKSGDGIVFESACVHSLLKELLQRF